jgi:hypothetical protein
MVIKYSGNIKEDNSNANHFVASLGAFLCDIVVIVRGDFISVWPLTTYWTLAHPDATGSLAENRKSRKTQPCNEWHQASV